MQKVLGIDPKTCLMIGDNLNTDIPFGKLGGADSMLIMTGVTTWDFLAGEGGEKIETLPDYIIQNFSMKP